MMKYKTIMTDGYLQEANMDKTLKSALKSAYDNLTFNSHLTVTIYKIGEAGELIPAFDSRDQYIYEEDGVYRVGRRKEA